MAPDTNARRSLYDLSSTAFSKIEETFIYGMEKLKEYLSDSENKMRIGLVIGKILPELAAMLRNGTGFFHVRNLLRDELIGLLAFSCGSNKSKCSKEEMEEMVRKMMEDMQREMMEERQERMEKMHEVINNKMEEMQKRMDKMQEVINKKMEEMQKKDKMQKVINKKMVEMQKKMDKMQEEINYINYHNKIILERNKRCECPGGNTSLRIGTIWVL